jgi:hypothetical protein
LCGCFTKNEEAIKLIKLMFGKTIEIMEVSCYLESSDQNGKYRHITTMDFPSFKFYWISDNEVVFKASEVEPIRWKILCL